MGFLDNLGSVLKETGKDVADKAKEMADVTKLKLKISDEEGKIKDAYLEIGRLFCQTEAAEIPEEYLPYVQIVANAKVEIENLRAQINQIKGVKTCPGCGGDVPAEAGFCSACGTKIE